MKLLKFIICTLALFTIVNVKAQQVPKRELRAVWVATVFNIDWPKHSKHSSEKQQQDFIDMLDKFVDIGFNSVIVQVRPSSDAFYKSDIEPWSQWLSGRQGVAPFPYYDPLEFMIEQAHRRNMELHAWFNPFRAVVDTTKATIDSLHISNTKPEWIFAHSKNLYLNPGIPEARQYVIKVVNDVAKRYDVDGIHFDDYFYPYPVKGEIIADSVQYEKYTTNTEQTIEDWRRENVNTFVRDMYENLLLTKPHLKFGISPFGIWRNEKDDKLGSASRGLSNYDHLYADVRKWLQEGWIDYAAPQLYWNRGYKIADFDTLSHWWNNNCFDRHIYIGHGTFKIDKKAKQEEWRKVTEITEQIEKVRSYDKLLGSIFYSSKSVIANPLKFTDVLKEGPFQYQALPPTMPWKDSIPPPAPSDFRFERIKNDIQLLWDKPTVSNPATSDSASYFVVYKFVGEVIGDLSKPANIYKITKETALTIERKWAIFRKKYTYAITAVDRLHNESTSTQAITIKQKP